MPKTNTQIKGRESGNTSRIDQIKSEILSCSSSKYCKAEVYETWENIFEPNNQ